MPVIRGPEASTGQGTPLCRARGAGLSVIEPLYLTSGDLAGSSSRAVAHLSDKLRKVAPWAWLDQMPKFAFGLQVGAVFEWVDQASDLQFVRCAPGTPPHPTLAVAILAIASNLDVEASTDRVDVPCALLRPTPSTWLHSGAEVFVASFASARAPQIGGARMVEGVLQFGADVTDGLADFVGTLARLWPISFEALIIRRRGVLHLVDISLGSGDESANTQLLADALSNGEPLAELGLALANCTARLRPVLGGAPERIGSGYTQGTGWVCGPIANTVDAAERLMADGRKPILVIDRLSPTESRLLRGLAGLVLRHDGAASHITLLARASGLPVLASLQPSTANWPADGEIVTLSEAHAGIFLGEVPTEKAPIDDLVPFLTRTSGGSVALTTTTPAAAAEERAAVGLCRSEMQILAAPVASTFLKYLAEIARGGGLRSTPAEIASFLECSLEAMIIAQAGAPINYRLIDADLHELLSAALIDGEDLGDEVPTTVRGPRWALASGFYGWQIEMAASTAARLRENGPVDLILTIPSAFDFTEIRAVRSLFDNAVDRHPDLLGSLRFGVMIETPRTCVQASRLAEVADVFSFGLNDLTATFYGLDRNAWSFIGGYYHGAGLTEADPFSKLDSAVVGPAVENAIEAMRARGSKGPVFLCGEPAVSAAAHNLAARNRDVFVCAEPARWPEAVVDSARAKARRDPTLALAAPFASDWTDRMIARAAAAIGAGRFDLAEAAAIEWIAAACPLTSAAPIHNWKVLKKRLVAAIFGEVAGRFFLPGWELPEVADYVSNLIRSGDTIRISCFPNEISCHGQSEVIDPAWKRDELLSKVGSLDRDAALHVFPQQDEDQLCFRAAYSGADLLVEAGWGQAMYVFEAERGRHPIAMAHTTDSGSFKIDAAAAVPIRIVSGLRMMLDTQAHWLRSMPAIVSRLLGVGQFAVEGYFNPAVPDRVVIVDIDLPLDIAWNSAR